MVQIGRHVDYISRKGLIEVEDQDGLLVAGKQELETLKRDWRDSGATSIGDESEIRDTINIVFLCPLKPTRLVLNGLSGSSLNANFRGMSMCLRIILHRQIRTQNRPTIPTYTFA